MKVTIFNSEQFEKDINVSRRCAIYRCDFAEINMINSIVKLINAYTVEAEIPDGVELPAFPEEG